MINAQNVVANRYLKQSTSGPVNARLILGIYSNNIIHVYSPRRGADHYLVKAELAGKYRIGISIKSGLELAFSLANF